MGGEAKLCHRKVIRNEGKGANYKGLSETQKLFGIPLFHQSYSIYNPIYNLQSEALALKLNEKFS